MPVRGTPSSLASFGALASGLSPALLGPLERRVHFQDGHQVEAVARDGTLRVVGLHGEDGQIRRGVALLRGLGFGAELRKAARQVFRLADIHDGLVVLEEQDGLAL